MTSITQDPDDLIAQAAEIIASSEALIRGIFAVLDEVGSQIRAVPRGTAIN